MKIKRICKTCGAEFEVYESSLRTSNSSGKFCYRKCYTEHQKTLTGHKNNHCTSFVVKCANCGNEITTIPSRASIYKNRFCSLDCKHSFHHNYIDGERNVNWKGGASNFRGGDFQRIKKENFKDSFCVLCGTSKGVHIHHIIPYRLTKDNSPENLVPLCRKHHKSVEHIFVSQLEALGDYETTKLVLANKFNELYYVQLIRRGNRGKIAN